MPAYTTNIPNLELGPTTESLVLSVNKVTHVDLISEKDEPEAIYSQDLVPYCHI